MADEPKEVPTDTEDFGCFTNPFKPEPAVPAKKGDPAPTAPATTEE